MAHQCQPRTTFFGKSYWPTTIVNYGIHGTKDFAPRQRSEWISSQNQLVCFIVFDAEWTYQHQHKILFIPDEWTANDITAYRGELSPPLDGSLQLS